ncbi:MAG: CBS domain-containing protein [Planctomycetes bacterium]|nr:CBS domain-containing protein [Planctomycetota bacterium]
MFETRTIMSTDLVTVRRYTPIAEVIELIVAYDITGIPVVNDDGTLAGIVTEKDILSLLADVRYASGTAEQYMTREVVSFDVNEDFIAICECLMNNHFRRVPILSEGKLVGIVSRSDIIKYITSPLS